MNANLLTLFAPPTQLQAPASAPNNVFSGLNSSSASSTSNLGDLMFGQLLSAQLQNPQTATAVAQGGQIASQFGQITAQLRTQIQNLLQSGVTMDQIVNQLVQTLGSNVLTQLQQQLGFAPGTSAQQMLTQILTQA